MKIRKLKNRKFYSYTVSKFVTLREILELYASDSNLEVIDHEGNIVTDKTLLSALFELELTQGVAKQELDRRIRSNYENN